MKFFVTLGATVLLYFASFSVLAKSYLSHHLSGNQLTVRTTQGSVLITALHELAVEVKPIDHPLLRDDFPSFARAMSDPELAAVAIKVINEKSALTFATKRLSVRINKATMQIAYLLDEQQIAQEEAGFYASHTGQGFRFTLTEQERLMGTGERVLGMDRRGHRLPLYNRAHYGYGTHSEQMNYSIPAVVSSNKYIILYDNPAKGFVDLGKAEPNILQFEAAGGRQAYIFIAATSYPELIHQYVKVTGYQPLIPRWALGNHASRFGYRSQTQVLDTIAKFRQNNTPVESIILDLYWFGKDVQGHMGNLDWDKDSFPAPLDMMAQLNRQGVKTTLISEPFILTTSQRWQEALERDVLAKNAVGTKVKTFNFFFGNTGLIDVFNESAGDWFKNIYKDLAQQGVTGVWGDLGEPEVHPSDMRHYLSEQGIYASGDEIHNAYGHQWAKLVDEALTEANPNQRPFILMRAGFAGSQRFGMLPWTGDVSRSWDGLKPQPELTMQMGMLGLAYTHSDLGGFAGGEQFDKEMYIRWLQYGVFQPIFRPHAQDNIAPEPVFHDDETLSIVNKYLELRYRLTPYNYTLAYENSTTGMPLMRPLFFEHEYEPFISMTDAFMWGDAFYVKTVTEPNLKSTSLHLPTGQWTDFWTGKQYQGGEVVEYPLTLERLPVLVKGGSIIPTVAPFLNDAAYSTRQLQLDVYFDPTVLSSVAKMYNDDGVSADALATGEHEVLTFNGSAFTENGLARYSLNLDRTIGQAGTYTGMPTSRYVTTIIHHYPNKPNQIVLGQQPLALFISQKEFELAKVGAFYDPQSQQLHIKFAWDHSNLTLSVN